MGALIKENEIAQCPSSLKVVVWHLSQQMLQHGESMWRESIASSIMTPRKMGRRTNTAAVEPREQAHLEQSFHWFKTRRRKCAAGSKKMWVFLQSSHLLISTTSPNMTWYTSLLIEVANHANPNGMQSVPASTVNPTAVRTIDGQSAALILEVAARQAEADTRAASADNSEESFR